MTDDAALAMSPVETVDGGSADRRPIGERLLAPGAIFLLLLAVAVLLRASTFGDPHLNGDEDFYHAVGIAMHHGALPYVDIWDRKPFGLFAIYYLIAFLGTAPAIYQVVATLFAAGTAWVIAAIARPQGGAAGAFLAALVYLLWLGPLEGYGGQSPVFYNFFVATAALIVVRSLPELRQGRAPARLFLAMVLAGTAITVKTTAFFEGAFLGLYAGAVLLRSGGADRAPTVLLWATVGATPALAIAAAYALTGHWAEYWHAMVIANFAKPTVFGTSLHNGAGLLVVLAPVIACAAAGLWLDPRGRTFLLGWIGAALMGLLSLPNFFHHYAMPLLVPLCVAAASLLGRGLVSWGLVAALSILSAAYSQPFRWHHAAQSRRAIAELEQAIRAHSAGGPLFVYQGPPQLYWRTGHLPPTPLIFPTHLSQQLEKDVSHLSTLAETERVLAGRPGAVVISEVIEPGPRNEQTYARVMAYVRANCRKVTVTRVYDYYNAFDVGVWGDCRAKRA